MTSSIATAFFTGISFYLEYNSELNDLELTFEQISKTSIPGLVKSLYEIDDERVNFQAKGLLQIRPFVRAVITDENSNIISDVKEMGVKQVSIVSRKYELYYRNGIKRVFLGKLIIYATQQYMEKRLQKKLIFFFTTQGVKTFLVSFIIMFIFNFHVVRHLKKITRFYEELLKKKIDTNVGQEYKKLIKLNKLDHQSKNELDFLVATMNEMNLIVGNLITSQEKDIIGQKHKAIINAKFAAIGQLASGVGHEIRNPLTIAIGNLKHLKLKLENRGVLTESIKKIILRQEIAHDRIEGIVESLRTYSRTDPSNDEIINLHELIRKTILLVSMMYENQGINLEIDLSEQNYHVRGNSGKFQQMLMILLSNAKDAVEDLNFPTIKITTRKLDSNIVICVSDNGVGIPQEVEIHIFDSFYTTKEIGKGVGIGLSILKKIVEEMNGFIKVDTEIDIGSSFSLFFPLNKTTESNLSITKESREDLKDFSLSGSALVVDDEKGVRELLVNYLSDMGLKVSWADDGDSALALVKKQKYDYICTDMTMPKMSGDKFIQKAKKLPFGKTRYFVVTGGITASYSKEKEELIKEIVDAYIYKPFTHKKIYEALTGQQRRS
ncbi:MAG: response regulator [Bacteriovoracaceae bacterium]|nr:response regulator [Bacteriovoracaceae bacterium]